MKFRSLNPLAAIASVILPLAVHAADIVEVSWDDHGRFAHSATVPPGKFVEVCGKLKKGERIDWSFSAGQPLDFNIHYHAGARVEYPAKRDAVAALDARLEVAEDQHYCWMWKSNASEPVAVRIHLKRL